MPSETDVRPARRVDGSMSLLVDMMTNTLDESYAEAAARKRAEQAAGTPSPERGTPPYRAQRSRRALALVLLLALGLVAGTAAAQVRNRQAAQDTVRAQLVADVDRRTEATDSLNDTAVRLRQEVDRLQAMGLSTGAAGRQAAERLAALELAAAVSPVTGPGLVVRLDDAPPPEDGEPPAGDDGRVLDRDLQDVVNALWAAGAEAIAVNGLRLTALTAIRSAGESILVDYRPLSPPYTVRAIGNPKVLEPSFVDGETGRRLATFSSLYGIELAVQRTDRQALAGSGSPSLRLAEPEASPS